MVSMYACVRGCRGVGNAEIWYNYRQMEDMQLNKSQNVEFAGTGTSPAVLTETVLKMERLQI